ncbi:TPA: EAL domain-containing response regulator [Photobacterium damselae]|uniref:EAL domain-containing response regulator n=1 Tax=Photobacterium damselae TaxID=38293 RepID=UPI001F3976C6|nr:EAL domain-containing response regulator [Photobacterium damselae]UKA30129.1 EAL domain-containing response regulator [Photobacterium damselae subsp. damselae]
MTEIKSTQCQTSTLPMDKKILVLEDHAFQRWFLVNSIKQLGYQSVLEAASGQEALAICQQQAIDIILCDLELPDMDGIEVLRKLSEQKKALSIILCSAVDESVLCTVSKMVEASNLVLLGQATKPIEKDHLSQLLNKSVGFSCASSQQNPGFQPSLIDIQQALENKEFSVHYQPKVCLDNGQWTGIEAFIRWPHPVYGMIAPNRFIPIAEQDDIINALFLYIADQAITDLANLHKQGWQGTVAINLAAKNLVHFETMQAMVNLVADSEVNSKDIVLELTERQALPAQAERSLEAMARLNMKGFKLSLDDFGTGFSSLQQLDYFPFSEVKLDRSFVDNCQSSIFNQTVIEFCMTLAKRLNLNVVFEGIEDIETLNFLRTFQYGSAQGFFIAKPMPYEQLLEWHQQWQLQNPIQDI